MFLGTNDLDRVVTISELGISFDEKLTFKLHCDLLISKTNGLLSFIKRRAKKFDNIWVNKTLYLSQNLVLLSGLYPGLYKKFRLLHNPRLFDLF
jgi:hypothetical protein